MEDFSIKGFTEPSISDTMYYTVYYSQDGTVTQSPSKRQCKHRIIINEETIFNSLYVTVAYSLIKDIQEGKFWLNGYIVIFDGFVLKLENLNLEKTARLLEGYLDKCSFIYEIPRFRLRGF